MLQEKVQPYKIVKLAWLAHEVGVNDKEVRQLLSDLILEQRIEATIDGVSGFLEMTQKDAHDQRYEAMETWAQALVNIHMNLTQQPV